MEGGRLHGNSSMAFLLQNDRICAQSFQSLLMEGTSAAGFLGSQSMNCEDHESRLGQLWYRPVELEEACDDDFDECLHQPEKKRRLTADQVQFLEKSFEIENKLEPERKVQLAKDLGLQPRQVAIWFQNRRARWKTKHLEKEYEALKSSFDQLKLDHEKLLKEKEELEAEVLSLTNKLLLKEKDAYGSLELFEIHKFQNKLQSLGSCLIPETKNSDPGAGAGAGNQCKQDDLRSSNSTTLDSESPHYIDEGGYSMIMEPTSCSSNALGPDQSDLSHAGEAGEAKGCSFLNFQDSSCNYAFQVGDQAFWFWP